MGQGVKKDQDSKDLQDDDLNDDSQDEAPESESTGDSDTPDTGAGDDSEETSEDDAGEGDDSEESETEAAPAVASDSDESEAEAAPPVASDGAVPAIPMPSSGDPQRDKIAEYLQAKYAQAADNSKVLAAQDHANSANNIANFGRAFEGLARADSMAHGGAGVDNAFYDSIAKQGQQGVQQAVTNRQGAIQEVDRQEAIKTRIAQNMVANGTLEQKKLGLQFLAKKEEETNRHNLAMEGIGNKKADAQAAKAKADNARLADIQNQRIQDKKDAVDKSNAFKDFQGLQKDVDNMTASSRSDLGDATKRVAGANRLMTYADVKPDELSAAQNSPEAKAALMQKLNKLSPQQYTEVVSGLMSQISPGAGSYGQLHEMKADTAGQTMANVKQFVTGKMAEGGMGDFLFSNLRSIKNESDTSQARLDSHNNKLKSKHPLAFSHPEFSPQADAMVQDWSTPSPTNTGSSGSGTLTAQDQQAIDWANKNPQDPRARTIMQLHGMTPGTMVGQQ